MVSLFTAKEKDRPEMNRLTETENPAAPHTETLFEADEIEGQSKPRLAPEVSGSDEKPHGTPRGGEANPAAKAFAPLPEATYLVADNAPYYRPMLRALNDRRHQPPLSAEEVQSILKKEYQIEISAEDTQRLLENLEGWENVEGHQSLKTRVLSAKDFGRKNRRYRITEGTHLFVECEKQRERMTHSAGSLQGHRLPVILGTLTELANQLERGNPDAVALATQLTQVKGALDELRRGADNFSIELNKLMDSTEKLEIEHFQEYCTTLVNYLQDFSAELQKQGGRIRQQIERIENIGPEKMIQMIAQLHMAPHAQGDAAHALNMAAEEPRADWEAIRTCFVPIQDSRMQELEDSFNVAVMWCVETARRISERGLRRTDRAAEYMHLAEMFSECENDQAAHELGMAAFGLWSARHLSGGGEDDNVNPDKSFWKANPEEIVITPQQHSISVETRKPTPVKKPVELQAEIREKRKRRREEEKKVLAAFDGGVKMLSELEKLSTEEFKHLRNWIGRALEAPAEADGSRRAESMEGGAIIVLRQKGKKPTVELRTQQGTLNTPDFEIEVRAR